MRKHYFIRRQGHVSHSGATVLHATRKHATLRQYCTWTVLYHNTVMSVNLLSVITDKPIIVESFWRNLHHLIGYSKYRLARAVVFTDLCGGTDGELWPCPVRFSPIHFMLCYAMLYWISEYKQTITLLLIFIVKLYPHSIGLHFEGSKPNSNQVLYSVTICTCNLGNVLKRDWSRIRYKAIKYESFHRQRHRYKSWL